MPLNTLGFIFRETNDAFVNVERMFEVLDAQGRRGEDIDEPEGKPLRVTAGDMAFEHVDFGYEPARQILLRSSLHTDSRPWSTPTTSW